MVNLVLVLLAPLLCSFLVEIILHILPNEYVYDLLMQTVPYVPEDSEEAIDAFCVPLWEPDMSEEVFAEIIYTGTEEEEAGKNLENF